jgi:hypothetical protein
MAPAILDVPRVLQEAVEDARAAGLTEAADELEARTSAAFTSSSECLGEVGLAIRHFLSRERGKVRAAVQQQLRECLAAVGKVWPRLGWGTRADRAAAQPAGRDGSRARGQLRVMPHPERCTVGAPSRRSGASA